MDTRDRRKRQALYEGIADAPPPPALTERIAIDQFTQGYARKPHLATMMLIRDMHRMPQRPARRPLPGPPDAA